MTEKELQDIFESEFNWESWKKVMHFVFPEFQFALTQQSVPLDNELRKRYANHIKQHGSGELADGEKIVLFDVSLKESVRLDRNVKSVRRLISNEIFKGYQIGLGVFHNDDKTKWRFTLVVREFSEALTIVEKKPESFTYVFGKDEKGRTAAKRFFDLAKKSTKGLADLEEAFSVEALSDDFFTKYKEVYREFEADIIKNPSRLSLFRVQDREKAARDFVKRMMGRVIFLYFLQKRGWMGCKTKWENGDEKFMKRFFEAAEENDLFYHNYLRLLFFHVLAEKRSDVDDDCIINGKNFNKVPYLNGGLFEIDEHHPDMLTLSYSIFKKFFEILESYNFTIIEDDPEYREVAVDPEMLGHIFENLLEDNKEKGAFYTPKEVVQYMCRESLIEYLTTKLSARMSIEGAKIKEALRQFVILHHFAPINDLDQRADEYIIQALKDVKVCDPAIGSGAFPMGILHEMFRMIEFFEDRDTLYSIWGINKWDAARFKESIIQNSIYGVDIEKGAVDIARLRFWLSIIIDEAEPKPLPNLDYKIVAGDSLLSKFDGHIIEIDWNIKVDSTLKGDKGAQVAKLAQRIKDGLQQIAEKQEEFFQAEVDSKEGLLADIRKLKIELLLDQLKYNKGRYIDMHPLKGGFAPTAKEKKYNLEVELEIKKFDDLQHDLLQLLKDEAKPFNHFDWNLDFPEVLNPLIKGEDRGFDIIIANPPYVNFRDIKDDELKQALLSKYATAEYQSDLYILFIQLAFDLLKEQLGQFSLIVPNSLTNNLNNSKVRKLILNNSSITSLVNTPIGVFKEATVDTNIICCSLRLRTNDLQAFDLKGGVFVEIGGVTQNDFLNNHNYDFDFLNDSGIKNILTKIERDTESLDSITDSSSGIKEYEIGKGDPPQKKSHLEGKVYNSQTKIDDTYRKHITGSEINHFVVIWNGEYIKYGSNLAAPRNARFFKGPRIIIREILGDRKLICAYTDLSFTIKNTAHIFIAKNGYYNEYLCAIINSKMMGFYFRNRFSERDKVFPKAKIGQCRLIPIRRIDEGCQLSFKKILEKITEHIKLGKNYSELEDKLNLMTYKLYDLSYGDILLIEPDIKATETEYNSFKL